ncbi:hypothetical protein K450DRAFT_246284 [Umbelopsis ramanniana AG]|uniref:Uncharacterized protein n=1 Tax=Umbelopsis ramanniana AG TaxID=1314678 RepID=A0AAD5E892_UMBRA|nr:uncharacterized protein K450DRAFT_246284 [Umbelopsis ramanniana AG]KAI8578539.1 hypothetical protein K450DRAFT_246284 [Umbelopsis ramanniana AG]
MNHSFDYTFLPFAFLPFAFVFTVRPREREKGARQDPILLAKKNCPKTETANQKNSGPPEFLALTQQSQFFFFFVFWPPTLLNVPLPYNSSSSS